MELLFSIFHEAIFKPLLNFLIFVLNILPGNDLGLSIIVVTILIRLVFYPLSYKALRSQKKLIDLQPKLKQLQEKYKHDKAKQTQAVMGFYKEHNVNPFTGCIPFIIQIPVLLGLYRVFLMQLTPETLTPNLYHFIPQPEHINFIFLGVINLAFPSPVLAVLAGFSQYLYSRVMFSQKKNLAVPIVLSVILSSKKDP